MDKKLRVLIVEDDEATARSISGYLEAAGFQCDMHGDAASAMGYITVAGLQRIDALVLDTTLPIMDGFDAIDIMRRSKSACAVIPILVLTDDASVESKVKALNLGADDYITKPFHKDELVARLKAILRGREYGATEAIKFLQLLPKTGDTVSEPLASV